MKRNKKSYSSILKPSLCIILFSLLALPVKAGDGDGHLGIQTGVMYPRVLDFTLSYTKETSYHNAYEFFLDYYTQWNDCGTCGKVCRDSFWKSRYSLTGGAVYKPSVKRGRNNVGRLRAGFELGTNTRDFVLGLELGYEHVWTFRSGIQFVFIQKNKVNFWAKPRFLNGAQIGFRIPM